MRNAFVNAPILYFGDIPLEQGLRQISTDDTIDGQLFWRHSIRTRIKTQFRQQEESRKLFWRHSIRTRIKTKYPDCPI